MCDSCCAAAPAARVAFECPEETTLKMAFDSQVPTGFDPWGSAGAQDGPAQVSSNETAPRIAVFDPTLAQTPAPFPALTRDGIFVQDDPGLGRPFLESSEDPPEQASIGRPVEPEGPSFLDYIGKIGEAVAAWGKTLPDKINESGRFMGSAVGEGFLMPVFSGMDVMLRQNQPPTDWRKSAFYDPHNDWENRYTPALSERAQGAADQAAADKELAERAGMNPLSQELMFYGSFWGNVLSQTPVAGQFGTSLVALEEKGATPEVVASFVEPTLDLGLIIVLDRVTAAPAGRAGSEANLGRGITERPVRVTQYFDPKKGGFPIEGEYALSSEPTLLNRLIDGITGDTTWVAPRPAVEMSQWQRFWTGVGKRRCYVEFDAFRGELQSPGRLKSLFSNNQQVILGRVRLSNRDPVYGRSGFNYVDAAFRYVGLPGAGAAAAYIIYKEVDE